MDIPVERLMADYASSISRGRLGRFRALRAALRRCHEDLLDIEKQYFTEEDRWEVLKKDVGLLRAAIHLQPNPHEEVLGLYDRLKYAAKKKEVVMEDAWLAAALGAFLEDLDRWSTKSRAVALARYPQVMPAFRELHDRGEIPARWSEFLRDHPEYSDSPSFDPVPWERDD